VSLTLSQLARPSYAGGYARSAGESAYPDDWKSLQGLWVPSLGATGQTLRDVSGEKNHGTLNSATWVAGGLNFDAIDDYVSLPASISTGLTKWTMLLWIWSDATTLRFSPFGDDLSSLSCCPTVRYDSSGRYEFYAGDGAAFYVSARTSSVAGATGRWQQVAFVYDGSAVASIYLDGKKDQDTAVTGGAANSAGTDVRLGGGANTSTKSWGGTYGSARLYSRALTDVEIANDWANPLRMLRPVRHMPYATGEAPPAGTTLYVFHGLIAASETGDTVLSVFAPWWDADEDAAGTILPQMMHHLSG